MSAADRDLLAQRINEAAERKYAQLRERAHQRYLVQLGICPDCAGDLVDVTLWFAKLLPFYDEQYRCTGCGAVHRVPSCE